MSEVCTYGVTEEGTRRLTAVTKHQSEQTHEQLTTRTLKYMRFLCPCSSGSLNYNFLITIVPHTKNIMNERYFT